METAQALKARLASLSELRGLFQALRALAAARLQEAQAALAGIRSYSEIVSAGLGEALNLPGAEGALAGAVGKASALVVVSSEHGFAGGFNARLIDRLAESRRPGMRLVVVGNRGATVAAERGFAPDRTIPMATHVDGVAGAARKIFDALRGYGQVEVVFGSYQQGGGFEVRHHRILPPDPPAREGPLVPASPLHQLPTGVLVERLEWEYLYAELEHAMMESFACENAARLRVMEAADHAISDKLDILRRAENDLRQETITSEILDVVTGSEAISALWRRHARS